MVKELAIALLIFWEVSYLERISINDNPSADNQLELLRHCQGSFGPNPTRPLLFSSEMSIEPRNLVWRPRHMIHSAVDSQPSLSSPGKSGEAPNFKACGSIVAVSALYRNARHSTSSTFTARKQ